MWMFSLQNREEAREEDSPYSSRAHAGEPSSRGPYFDHAHQVGISPKKAVRIPQQTS